MPLSPSTITFLASAAVGATRASRRAVRAVARTRISSAPVRVLPNPRPARSSHTRQSPSGGSWLGRAQNAQSKSNPRASSRLSAATRPFLRASGSEASQPACKHLTRILREIGRLAVLFSPRQPDEHSAMARDRIGRRLLVVELHSVAPASGTRARGFRNRRSTHVVQRFRRPRDQTLRSPNCDTAPTGKGDARIFRWRPLGCDPEHGRSCCDLVAIRLGCSAAPGVDREPSPGTARCRSRCPAAGARG
jgi:hypothetical protein